MKTINFSLKSIRFNISSSILFFVFSISTTTAQNFNIVGCKPAYETLYLNLYKNELLYSRGERYMCDTLINGIGSWNQFRWSRFGTGLNKDLGGAFFTSTTYNNQLYIGGHFYSVGGKTTNKIARWNGQQWDSVGSGLDDQNPSERINAMAVYKNELYVAGLIRQVNGVSGYNHIAVWNGTTWRKIAGVFGSLPEINCMAVYKNELYVGGLFYQAGSTPASFIARWNGQQWKSVGLGTSYVVNAMVVDTIRNVLYVTGNFKAVQDTLRCKVAQWDGVNWKALGNDSVFPSNVSALEMYHGYLYAAGGASLFDQKETVMARWDGNEWEPIPGFDGPISSLQTYKDELYRGGGFTKIGNDSIPYLARYYSADSVFIGTDNKPTLIKELVVYPNPVENTLQIKSNLEFKSISIYNAEGKKVQTLNNPNSKSIHTSDLSNGVYLLKAVSKSGEEYNARFVVERE